MSRISKEILGDLVYKQIVKMLLNNDLKPGQKIQKKELADMLEVSMTPVSEALSRLIREGIVEQKERRELYVKIFTDNDMIELFEVRAGLEGTALHICMEKLDEKQWNKILSLFDDFTIPIPEKQYKDYQIKDQEFHSSILKMSGNELILEFIDRCEFILRCYQKGLIRTPDETLMEHKRIIEAIRNKQTELAQQRIMEHHWTTRERLKVH
ncbi:MAG: GntR family transcriptional regulator [Spirochaetaceae bacterium]|jgi:DNA-binding GntR family transcriptional regulator|nr:GntR family transcriptional regulator [Spirochaetaceae bacterium]